MTIWNNLFDKFRNNKILIIGDVMLDSYLIGRVDRISPEAPVPVVDIKEKINKLGGAANVALNIKELGAEPIICSVIGKDNKSLEMDQLLKENKLITKYIYKSKDRMTTNKIRVIGNQTQLIRIDEETTDELDGDTYQKLKENIIIAVAENKIDAIILQDYDKGVISFKMIDHITKLSIKRNIPVFVDPKHKNFDLYHHLMLFKPNFNELKRSIKIDHLHLDNLETIKPIIEKIIIEKNIKVFYTTLGDKGILLSYLDNDKFIHKHIESRKRSVADVSGAGDTVISISTLLNINNINNKLSHENIARISNIGGGLVCEKVGVVPINKLELLNEVNNVFR